MTESRPDPLAVLDQHGWLSWQPRALRDHVRRVGRVMRLKPREALSFEGDEDPRMFGIIEGFIGCQCSHRHQQPVLGTLLGPGYWFGEGPLIEANKRQLTYCAMQKVTVLAITRPALASLREAFPDLDLRIAQLAASQVRYVTEVACELLIENVADRITAVLLRLCGDYPAPVILPLLQAELGEMSNASRNSVSKVLAALARHGLVRPGYGGIEVPDPPALARWLDARVMRG